MLSAKHPGLRHCSHGATEPPSHPIILWKTAQVWSRNALEQGTARHGTRRRGLTVTSIDLAYPFTGRWLVRNSPADKVPSHGTTLFATSFAIDFVPVDEGGRTAPFTPLSLVHTQPPGGFPGFGRPVLSPIEGTVVAVHDSEVDHPAYRGLPSLCYALSQRRRIGAGWRALAGNHVLVRHATGVVVALCHLRSASAVVRPGQEVQVGDVLGRCGNSGNSTEPHLHVQAVDTGEIAAARAVPLTVRGGLPRNGEVIVVPDR